METLNVKHIITAFVMDRPGVLNRVASLFRRRGFNISSLAVGHSEVPGLSRMTFVVYGDDYTVDQVTKQLRKLIDVIHVAIISKENHVSRELSMIKVKATPSNRGEIIQIVDIFRANIIDVSHESVTIEVTGDEDKIDSLFNLLKPFGVLEMMRTGVVAMLRGAKSSSEALPLFGQNGGALETPERPELNLETGSV